MKVGEHIKMLAAEQDSLIESLLREGNTYQRTAEKVSCSIGKVQYVAKKAGLLRRQQSANILKEVK
jgi:hypothetical protein